MNPIAEASSDHPRDHRIATARVAVIGGGVIGCSIAYHLGRLGWGADTVVLEKAEIATGASAFAAGDLPQFSDNPLVSRLCAESIALYQRLERETGQAVGWHHTGGLRLAQTREQLRDFARHVGRARRLGIEMEVIGPNRAGELYPLLNLDGVVGAIWTPGDGHIDPASVTMALAAGARAEGVRILRRCAVRGLTRDDRRGLWLIETDSGRLETEVVVNAAGYGAAAISALADHHLPMTLHEHQYLLTEPIAEIADLGRPLPQLRDMAAPLYARQDRHGLLCSAYEASPVFREPEALPAGALTPDLDRSMAVLERCMQRLPCLRRTGIRTVVNAAVMRSPDGAPLIGPVPGLDGFFVATAFGGGFILGSVGAAITAWIVAGEPTPDLTPFDLRRFGRYASRAYTRRVVAAGHAYAGDVAYPHAETSAGRPLKTTPLTAVLKSRGAVLGNRNGWETALWFAPPGTEPADKPSFGRANWFVPVGAEIGRAQAAGLIELPCLARFSVEGPQAAALIDALTAGPLPAPGQASLSPVPSAAGGVAALARTACITPESWLVTASAAAEGRIAEVLRVLSRRFTATVHGLSDGLATLIVMGRGAEAILSAMLSDAEAPWRHHGAVARASLGVAPATVMRTDEAGLATWQIHVPLPFALAAYEALAAGSGGDRPAAIGLRAWSSLATAAGEPAWGSDITPALSPDKAGLGHLVAPHKQVPDRTGGGERLVLLAIAPGEALPAGLELVRDGDRPIGLTSSAWWSYAEDLSLAFARIDEAAAEAGSEVIVEVLGEPRRARIRAKRFYGGAYGPQTNE